MEGLFLSLGYLWLGGMVENCSCPFQTLDLGLGPNLDWIVDGGLWNWTRA